MLEAFGRENKSALEAQRDAQTIAFAPIVFQTARVARDWGILSELDGADPGRTCGEIAEARKRPPYAVQVLLESCLGSGVVLRDDTGRYRLSKTGWYLLHDGMTRANMDFSQDVCYQGMFRLEESLRNARPEGLKTFGPWPTIYEGLLQLPEKALGSWLAFDHFYSDAAFGQALSIVFSRPPARLLDVGGNTGKLSRRCLEADSRVRVTLADLPAQAAKAAENLVAAGFGERFQTVAVDLLDPKAILPPGHDAIWMSQFLDCFSEDQVARLLDTARTAMTAATSLWILEPCWDRQKFETAAICVQHLSPYFTALANGNSKMFLSADLERLIRGAGLNVVAAHDGLGFGHTLWECRLPD